MLKTPRQETVTLETLYLLQRATDYLKRLPVNPLTRELVREIDAHLGNPSVSAARREAEAADLRSTRRIATQYAPAGHLQFGVIVEGDTVTIKVPPLKSSLEREARNLSEGISLKLRDPGEEEVSPF